MTAVHKDGVDRCRMGNLLDNSCGKIQSGRADPGLAPDLNYFTCKVAGRGKPRT